MTCTIVSTHTNLGTSPTYLILRIQCYALGLGTIQILRNQDLDLFEPHPPSL